MRLGVLLDEFARETAKRVGATGRNCGALPLFLRSTVGHDVAAHHPLAVDACGESTRGRQRERLSEYRRAVLLDAGEVNRAQRELRCLAVWSAET
jgi:hypothetical protein